MKYNLLLIFLSILFLSACHKKHQTSALNEDIKKLDTIPLTYLLPTPDTLGKLTLEETLNQRRSRRNFQNKALTDKEISQILWASYGISMPRNDYKFLRGGLRTTPSAGALYPLEIYILIGNVNTIEVGVYKYISDGHKIEKIDDQDKREALCSAALNQEMIKTAPAVLFYSAIYERTTDKYGNRGRERYVCMDLGHSAQNVYLQAEALHLGTCGIGAFNDEEVKKVMDLPQAEEPLYIMPIGHYYN